MSPAEVEAQRLSWARGEMGMGNDAQERFERYGESVPSPVLSPEDVERVLRALP